MTIFMDFDNVIVDTNKIFHDFILERKDKFKGVLDLSEIVEPHESKYRNILQNYCPVGDLDAAYLMLLGYMPKDIYDGAEPTELAKKVLGNKLFMQQVTRLVIRMKAISPLDKINKIRLMEMNFPGLVCEIITPKQPLPDVNVYITDELEVVKTICEKYQSREIMLKAKPYNILPEHLRILAPAKDVKISYFK